MTRKSKKRRRVKSHLTRIDGSLKLILNKIKSEARRKYGYKITDREASFVAAKIIKPK